MDFGQICNEDLELYDFMIIKYDFIYKQICELKWKFGISFLFFINSVYYGWEIINMKVKHMKTICLER